VTGSHQKAFIGRDVVEANFVKTAVLFKGLATPRKFSIESYSKVLTATHCFNDVFVHNQDSPIGLSSVVEHHPTVSCFDSAITVKRA
jgi:hypothetical protein